MIIKKTASKFSRDKWLTEMAKDGERVIVGDDGGRSCEKTKYFL